jgi:hypothetical protein
MVTGVEVGLKPNVWRPTQLQLLLFPTSPPSMMHHEWWQGVMQDTPDETLKKRHEFTQMGTLGDNSVNLTADLVKLVWTISPRINAEEAPTTIPTLGTFAEAVESFVKLFRDWITNGSPPIKRLGFATSLILPATDHAEAYRFLGEWLDPVVQVDPSSSDFLYRVNRKRLSTSGIADLTINRISIWSAAKFSIAAHVIQPGSIETPQTIQLMPTQYSVMLSLDINSDGERENELPRSELRQLLEELVRLADEIGTYGDRP